MTAKEYLSQARTLDMRIKSKLQQIESLNELATSCTITYSDMPRNPNHGGSKVERAVLKIIDLQESLKKDVEDLVELKEQIMATIQSVADVELHAERGQAAEHLAQLLLGLAVVYRDVRARLEQQGDERRVAHAHADDRHVLAVYLL